MLATEVRVLCWEHVIGSHVAAWWKRFGLCRNCAIFANSWSIPTRKEMSGWSYHMMRHSNLSSLFSVKRRWISRKMSSMRCIPCSASLVHSQVCLCSLRKGPTVSAVPCVTFCLFLPDKRHDGFLQIPRLQLQRQLPVCLICWGSPRTRYISSCELRDVSARKEQNYPAYFCDYKRNLPLPSMVQSMLARNQQLEMKDMCYFSIVCCFLSTCFATVLVMTRISPAKV